MIEKKRRKGLRNMELTYTQAGEYRIPDLTMETARLGKYAQLRRMFLKENRKGLYAELILTGELNSHLQQIDRTAREQMEVIVNELAQSEGVNESLKQRDPMKWTGLMNNLRQAAEEMVLTELIYQ